MKYIKVLCIMLAVACAMTMTVSAADLFSIRTSLSTPPEVQRCTIAVACGDVLEINASDLEKRLGMQAGSMKGATITSLPGSLQGTLLLDGVAVEAYDYLSRDEIDRLCFASSENAAAVSVTIMPNAPEATTVNLYIQVLAELNLSPIIEVSSYETMKNISIGGFVNITDPEEDSVTIQIIKKPAKGEVVFKGQSFNYEPFSNMTGKDSFVICAIDSMGNYSDESVVEINIQNTKATFSYADMRIHNSQYAAVKLQENGVMAGRQIGNQWFFNPGDHVTRGEFIIMLLAASAKNVSPTVNTGLPNDSSIPSWLKPYVKKAIEDGIISSKQAFYQHEIPIRAEAVLMTDRAAKINDVKEYPLTMGDRDKIPDWAQPSYVNLAAYKMLDLHDGSAYPMDALTNAYAADLLWQLYKHCDRIGK